METIPHNPAGIYPAGPDYAHGLEVRDPARILFVSGTMGLDATGGAAATLETQLELIWANLGAILADADMSFDNVVRVTSYLRDRRYADVNAKARLCALGGRAVPTTAIVAETLETDWLVEVELLAAA